MDQYQNPIFISKSDRKSIEKNRRDQMKALYCKLCSLLPNQSPKGEVSMSDKIGEAASYVKKVEERLEVMKRKRNLLKARRSAQFISSPNDAAGAGEMKQYPRIEVHANASNLDVVLITGFQHRYMFKEAVRILHQEGADVVSAGFSLVDQTVFHTVYSLIGGSELEYEASRISERLRNFVADEITSQKIILSEN